MRSSLFGKLACITVLFVVSAALSAAERAITLSADYVRWHTDDTVVARGNVTAIYEGYKVSADSASADLGTNIAVFEGNVSLAMQTHTVSGARLVLDLKTKDWSLESAAAQLGPQTFSGSPDARAFIRSEELSGDETNLRIRSGSFTTCDREHPHYCIAARTLEIYPDSRIVARGVSFMVMDRELFSIGSFVIPIRGMKSSILPQLGSSAEEGMFLKTSYAYAATERVQGFLKLDLMSRRGIGVGADQTYSWSGASGLFNVYFLRDQELGANNFSGSVQHRQQVGDVNVSLSGDYRSNSYLYYPSSTYRNYRVALNRTVGTGSTALSYQSNVVSGLGDTTTGLASLRHTQEFTPDFSGRISMDMRSYRSSYFDGTDRELETELEFSNRGASFDSTLLITKRHDLDGSDYTGDDFYSSLDRMPELTLETDTYRLMDNPPLDLPLRLKFAYGRYYERPSGEDHGRFMLQADLMNKVFPIGEKTDLSMAAGFRQTVYESDMAQHVIRTRALLTTRYNEFTTSRITHSYQRPSGYTPFRFDYSGRYNYLRGVWDYQDQQRLRWSVSTGYDLERDSRPWQDLTLRLTATPSARFGGSLSTGYDLNAGGWRTLISRIRYANPDRFSVDVGSRYNLPQGGFDALRGRLALKIGSKWSADAIVSWNGYSDDFDYTAFRITRDLHCWEASLVFTDETGFRKDRGIMLDLRLKAFQADDRFGIGQYGQTFDTGMGEYYY
ncbi:MAG: LPS-assembly protein LptD [Armatimonadetes bacterium]|nr:LPS-assembly protein LptD [Armatimonadota bacterium]